MSSSSSSSSSLLQSKANCIRPSQVNSNQYIAARVRVPDDSSRRSPQRLQIRPSLPNIPALNINTQELLFCRRHEDKLKEVRRSILILFQEEATQEEEGLGRLLSLIDMLQRSGVDHHFRQEIQDGLAFLHKDRLRITEATASNSLEQVSLLFRLLRQARYPISSDVFCRFVDDGGDFLPSLAEDTRGMINLFEASFLNTGAEEILHRANAFAAQHLGASLAAGCSAGFIKETLESPYHMSLQRYKARQYLNVRRVHGGDDGIADEVGSMIQELGRMDFSMNQSLHRKELQEISSWWKKRGLAEELSFARDQCLKWYTWSLAALPNPKLSRHRIGLTKIIAFVYLLDDIFDVRGTLDELHLLTQAIHKWELSAVPSLPTYMRAFYRELYDTTDEVARMALEEDGTNPIDCLKKSWTALSDAFLLEAKWFAGKQVPRSDEYMRNAVVSCGLPLVLVHLSFLLGQGRPAEEHRFDSTIEVEDFVGSLPKLVSCPSMILRLWDDLGSAEDEEQVGFDGSILECLKKENPQWSNQRAREHVMEMISKAREELNRESFDPSTSFSPEFVAGCLNFSRMVRVMYSYDEGHKLPVLEEHIGLLFS